MGLWGLIVMTVGSAGVVLSAVWEVKTKEPVYALMMKIFPWVFGVGAIIYCMAG